ncbi:MAG: hypothetical protein PXX77_04245 [Gallionella sp.]|nr:hypothetical protein [Gallionella sp.]
MDQNPEENFKLTRTKMQGYINGGRSAIENALLLVLVRPRTPTVEDKADYHGLLSLLQQYNKLLAPYELPKANMQAANDGQGGSQ